LPAGSEIFNQADTLARSSVITYDTNASRFVYYARRWNNETSSYICQMPQGLLSSIHIHGVTVTSYVTISKRAAMLEVYCGSSVTVTYVCLHIVPCGI